MVDKLIHGHRDFLANYATKERAYLSRLASEGQSPDAVYIGCSDSRVVPELLTRSSPGKLFVVRNVANLVPPATSTSPSVAAALEYAVGVLGVSDVIVCGHDGCGGVQAALKGTESIAHLPGLASWLQNTPDMTAVMRDPDLDDEERLRFAVEENVLHQLEQLLTYSVVKKAVDVGTLSLHGWVYDIHTSRVRVFDNRAFVEPTELFK
jgi:carbonic anhydrase